MLSDTDDDVESLSTEKSDVSSAKSLVFVFKPSGKSLIYTKKTKSPRIEPCGKPALIFDQFEHWPLRTTFWCLSLRNGCILTRSVFHRYLNVLAYTLNRRAKLYQRLLISPEILLYFLMTDLHQTPYKFMSYR